MSKRQLAICLWWLVVATSPLVAQQETPPSNPEESQRLKFPNLSTKTLGGLQLWSDVYATRGWRIQQHAVTKHHRLLDEKKVRRAWGSLEECKTQFEQHKDQLPPMQRQAIVVLHGLGRSQNAMRGLAGYLGDNVDDTNIVNVTYASGRLSFAAHASNLLQLLEGLREDGVEEVSFVAHSMGNLVVRHMLSTLASQNPDAAMPRFHRMVMLGPPNQGSHLASLLKTNPIFRVLTGMSGRQIADIARFEQQFATPEFEFGIIAGGSGKQSGRNPILEGDDDLVVSVEETKLAGARDFLVVPAIHTLMMNHEMTQQCAVRFLRDGYFRSEAERTPLPSQTTH